MNQLRSFGMLLCVLAVSLITYAQEKPYSIGSCTSVLSNFRRQLAATKPNEINRLQLQISSTRHLEAVINKRIVDGTVSEKLMGSIANVPNSSFFLMIENNSVQGHILLRDSKQAYTYSSDNNGAVFVQETDINKIICIGYKEAVEPAATAARDATAMSVTDVANLQSYPGGNGCVLLDFDGDTVADTYWNMYFNMNQPIVAAPSTISDADKQLIWESVSEAFRPFSLNITTSEAVFNAHPARMKIRCVFTPTNFFAPNTGGIAFITSFYWGNTPCYVFNTGAKSAGDAAAHEIGHTLNLEHDGRPGEEYYSGQGNWAPIMGIGYTKSLVQWSKGEYANANNTQDDLANISMDFFGVGYRADDYGNTTTAATLLTMDALGNVSNKGIIERTADVDMFSFTTSGGPVNLTFNPNTYYPTLDILATLYDNNGTVITISDLPGLNAGISTTLAAGKYYVSVTGTGAGNPATTGYSNYGSLGNYTITGTIPNLIVLSIDTGTPRKTDNPPSSKQVASLVLSPNPTANRVKLQYGKRNSFFDVTIRDVNGAVVCTASHIQTGQQVNIASLTAGLYFVTINTGKETITKQLIKR